MDGAANERRYLLNRVRAPGACSCHDLTLKDPQALEVKRNWGMHHAARPAQRSHPVTVRPLTTATEFDCCDHHHRRSPLMLEGPNPEGFISHFLLRTPQQLAATIRIKASIDSVHVTSPYARPPRLATKSGRTLARARVYPRPCIRLSTDLEIPVKIAIIDSDLISVVGRLGKSQPPERMRSGRAIPAADHAHARNRLGSCT